MQRLIKILTALVALLLLPNIVLLAYLGMLAAMAGDMVNLAKGITILSVLIVAEVLCILELTRNDL
jgi:hypothetical protein